MYQYPSESIMPATIASSTHDGVSWAVRGRDEEVTRLPNLNLLSFIAAVVDLVSLLRSATGIVEAVSSGSRLE